MLADMTIIEASKASGCSHATICNVEGGKHKPTKSTLTKLSRAYACDISHFYKVDIETVRTLATGVIVQYFGNPEANPDRKAAIASDLLVRLPESSQTDNENLVAEQYPDFWRSPDLHAYASDNCKAVTDYKGHELVVSGPTRCSKTLRILEYIFYLHFTQRVSNRL